MKRVMCIWFPQWSRQRADNERERLRISACGLRSTGQSPFQSEIRNPQSTIDDPWADLAALRRVARWCRRFSPRVALEETDAPESLLLDVTGCGHLFGGEHPLAEQAVRELGGYGFTARAAIADTIGAAWAVTHSPKTKAESRKPNENHHDTLNSSRAAFRFPLSALDSFVSVVPPGRQAEVLASLPIEALRLPAAVVSTLQELGLWRIGQLGKLPRADLPARFGTVVTKRLDQALGRREELLTPERPPEPIQADGELEPPTADRRAVQAVLRRLLTRVIEQLTERREGALQLLCRLDGGDGKPLRFAIGLVRPSNSARHLWELMRLQLERITVPESVSAVRLRAAVTAPLEDRQDELFDDRIACDRQQQLAVLVNRLSSRLGRQAVLRVHLFPDAQPERAVRCEPLVGRKKSGVRSQESEQAVSNAEVRSMGFPWTRPLCLHRCPLPVPVTSIVPDGPPIRFSHRGCEHVVGRCWGPERIETGWWRSGAIARDYYRLETTTGRRFWLFHRRHDDRWFLQGEFE